MKWAGIRKGSNTVPEGDKGESSCRAHIQNSVEYQRTGETTIGWLHSLVPSAHKIVNTATIGPSDVYHTIGLR